MRIAIVTDKKIIKSMKLKHPQYFQESMYSCLTLVRYDGKIVKYDLNSDKLDINVWINHNSIQDVEEFTTSS